MMDLAAIVDKVELNSKVEKKVSSEKAKEYIKLMQLQEEVNQEIIRIYDQLDEEEKNISQKIIMELLSIPEYVNVKEAAYIIGVSEQMIRRYCSENKLHAEQTMPGSGKWRIETTQLMKYPGWKSYVNKRTRMKEQSRNIANFMNSNIDKL
ncbi:DNA-binding protein [Lentibacillus lipolyticus]|nr:DNA-binding protein [Lentibacillus lipolyticus]